MTSPSVEEVRSLYSKAEAAIKLYERIGLDNLTIPLVILGDRVRFSNWTSRDVDCHLWNIP